MRKGRRIKRERGEGKKEKKKSEGRRNGEKKLQQFSKTAIDSVVE